MRWMIELGLLGGVAGYIGGYLGRGGSASGHMTWTETIGLSLLGGIAGFFGAFFGRWCEKRWRR
jgi:hypothetical protein